MINLSVREDGGVYYFTLVRPDTTYISGSRESLGQITKILSEELLKLKKEER